MAQKRTKKRKPPSSSLSTGSFLDQWLSISRRTISGHRRVLLTERTEKRIGILDELRGVLRSHYVDPAVTEARLKVHGATKTAELLRDMLPETARTRSGELGEVLATEMAVRVLGFTVPIFRLRWKDGRNMALRGDDLVAFLVADGKPTRYMKGESKSRATLTAGVLEEADDKLLEDDGRPSRHSVLFVAHRLYEQDDNATAQMLEGHLLNSFRGCRIEHLLFALSGNSPGTLLRNHLSNRPKPKCHAVGMHVDDHQQFIASVYEEP